MAELKIPLPCFVLHLKEVKKTRPDWPHIDEIGWLADNFRFDDVSATYQPQPDEPYRPVECATGEGGAE